MNNNATLYSESKVYFNRIYTQYFLLFFTFSMNYLFSIRNVKFSENKIYFSWLF